MQLAPYFCPIVRLISYITSKRGCEWANMYKFMENIALLEHFENKEILHLSHVHRRLTVWRVCYLAIRCNDHQWESLQIIFFCKCLAAVRK